MSAVLGLDRHLIDGQSHISIVRSFFLLVTLPGKCKQARHRPRPPRDESAEESEAQTYFGAAL